MKHPAKQQRQRRSILRGALALPAAVAAGATTAAASAPPLPAAAQAAAHPPHGYHLSDHIRRYYALAKY